MLQDLPRGERVSGGLTCVGWALRGAGGRPQGRAEGSSACWEGHNGGFQSARERSHTFTGPPGALLGPACLELGEQTRPGRRAKLPPSAPKCPQVPPSAPKCPQVPPCAPKLPPNTPKLHPVAPKLPPVAPKLPPSCPQVPPSAPKCPQVPPSATRGACCTSQVITD